MNLQALYDLKERLEHAAIAGTGLLQEDFRLRRAQEALAPLAKANPVFAKISAGTAALLNAPEDQRSTKLLDVLSLVDAVVYIQGITNLPGEFTALEPGAGSYVQAAYGELQPLLIALSGTGSGRTSLIRECWTNHPEYFSDFRVLPRVVKALGDNYAELTEMIGEILVSQGSCVIPLLKESFDPAGKAEMGRRVRLIAKLAGADENDWYVTILPDSKKEIREAVIQALSLSKENSQLLLDLCRTEKGKLKEAALRSLAAMDTEEAAEFWKKEIQKKPNTVACLKGVTGTLAADLAAEALEQYLDMLREKTSYTTDQLNLFVSLMDAICGKYSREVAAFWEQASGCMDDLARIKPDELVRAGNMTVAAHLQRCMMQSVLVNPCPEMKSLVHDLADKSNSWFLCCAFLVDLMTDSPEAVYDHYAHYLISESKLLSILHGNANGKKQILQALAACLYDKQGFCLEYRDYDSLTGAVRTVRRWIPGLDRRWAMGLAEAGKQKAVEVFDLANVYYSVQKEITTDDILMRILDPRDAQLCEICGQYFGKRVRHHGNLSEYLDALLRCGWKDWRGMIVQSVRKENKVRYHWVMEILERLPMPGAQKAAELRELNQMVESGSVSVWARIWPSDQIRMRIAQLEAIAEDQTPTGGNENGK